MKTAVKRPGDPALSVRVYLAQSVIDDPKTKVGATIKLGGSRWRILEIQEREFLLQWDPPPTEGPPLRVAA